MGELTEALQRTADRLGLELSLTIETRGHRFQLKIHERTAYGQSLRLYRDVGDVDVRDVVDWLDRLK